MPRGHTGDQYSGKKCKIRQQKNKDFCSQTVPIQGTCHDAKSHRNERFVIWRHCCCPFYTWEWWDMHTEF